MYRIKKEYQGVIIMNPKNRIGVDTSAILPKEYSYYMSCGLSFIFEKIETNDSNKKNPNIERNSDTARKDNA